MHGDGIVTPATFQKRAYWLLNNPKFVFIHYLDSLEAQQRKNTID